MTMTMTMDDAHAGSGQDRKATEKQHGFNVRELDWLSGGGSVHRGKWTQRAGGRSSSRCKTNKSFHPLCIKTCVNVRCSACSAVACLGAGGLIFFWVMRSVKVRSGSSTFEGSLRSCREPSAGCDLTSINVEIGCAGWVYWACDSQMLFVLTYQGIGRISKAQKNLDPALLVIWLQNRFQWRHLVGSASFEAIPHSEGPSEAEVEDFIQVRVELEGLVASDVLTTRMDIVDGQTSCTSW